MGYASKTASFQTVALEAGYTATIRKLTKQDIDACAAALLVDARRHTDVTPGQQAKMSNDAALDSAAYTTELLVRGISSWTLDDDNDQPLPVNKQTVQLLTGKDSTTLVEAIEQLAQGTDPNSDKAGSPTS